MDNQPLVSVLMSVYNGEKYLSEAIESILAQTYKNFEFIIINDSSTDSSKNIILSYTDPRIKVIDNEVNIGLTLSLNKGIESAKGKYIARMDADDVSIQERLKKQIDFMETHEDVDVCGTCAVIFDANGGIIGEFKNPETSGSIKISLFFYNPIAHPTVLMKKSVINSIGNYDPSFKKSQDYDLWCRIFLSGYNFFNLQENLLIYRNHIHNITNTSFDDQLFYADKCLQELYSKYLCKNNLNKTVSVFRSLFIGKEVKTNFFVILKILFLLRRLKKKIIKDVQTADIKYFDRYLCMIADRIIDQYKTPWKLFILNIFFKIMGFKN